MKQGPKNLNLFNLKLPISAFISVMHRISGMLLFFFIPFILFLFRNSLLSINGFLSIKMYFSDPLVKLLFIIFLFLLFYHLLAGIRHIFMDYGFFENKRESVISSKFVLYVSIIILFVIGVLIW